MFKNIFVVFWIALGLTSATNVLADNQNIRFQRIALEQGLSQENVSTAFQDSEGFMWFGTQEGLNRYDGYQFKVFTYSSRNKESLSSDWIYHIVEPQKNKLWVGTRGGINVFDKASQTFKSYRHDPEQPGTVSNDIVRFLFVSSTNVIWIGTDGGLNRYNPLTDDFTYVPLSDNTIEAILSITEDASGNLWVASSNSGVVKINPDTLEVLIDGGTLDTLTGTSLSAAKTLLVDSQQRLWIGGLGIGVKVITPPNAEQTEFDVWSPAILEKETVSHVYQDKANKVWLATDNGLYRMQPDRESFLHIKNEKQNPYSLSDNQLNYLYQDRGNVFWVGSIKGLNKWNTATSNFDHIRVGADKDKSLAGSYINTFHDGAAGKLWIGSLSGLDLLDVESGNIVHLNHQPDNLNSLLSDKVMALYSDNGDELYIGYQDKGMSKLNTKTMRFTHYESDKLNPQTLGAPGVTAIEPAGNNKLWVGTFGGGLNLFDIQTQTFTRYKHDKTNLQTLSTNRVLSVLRARNGLIWVGTWGGGLNIFNPTTATAMRIKSDQGSPNELGSNEIWSIFEDSKDNIWIGTRGGGVVKLSAENRKVGNFQFERISRYEGLPSSNVFGILEDSSGLLWLSTNRGLTKLDPETKELLNFDSSHGLQGNEFNAGAYYQSADGKLYFGGTNGVTSFFPEKISPNKHIPPVVLTKFQKLNEVFSIDASGNDHSNIQISHKDYLIAFEFAGLDFASPSNNRYLYKLEGFDNNWIEAGDIRKATYTNLPAGQYLFRVKASNNDGIWNEQGVDVALTVLPAPWYSWWAYTIYAGFALGLLYWIYRSYLNKLEKEANYRQELELEVKSRTVELREANEQLLNASVTDQLTGLHNRRYLNNIIEQQCASVFREFEENLVTGRCTADSGPRLFFLMFDLDGFKPINDTYGHDAGDKVICQVSDLLKLVCRKSDTVIRWGGDEFLIMGRVEEVSEIELLAERLRSKISGFGFDINLKQKMHLSCSIGYSMYPFSHHYPDSLSWEQVHLLADNALYKSKEGGRNQWTGILQSAEMPPVSIMNTLTQNIDNVIDEGYVRVKQVLQDGTAKVMDIQTSRR
ncbi:ligand-binding sensor domain-containing diguanylate cyclase [Aliiglaciecola sp. LCG003]|uniref:ligand-binding sensor domain-containing diguanylate cyclase n=1 Tax=Aliiglaciecola sp. LCG003 TaxID=3053655 RepID=UPI0025740FDB|nr:ligand-binding sensor domain-containing diguanylate cyclase [Aliiglaciecola sp. LCG003]WJG08504.1 two-component regulator propeller domain-containing protein [Aliiglaciecola sp. LCG003]